MLQLRRSSAKKSDLDTRNAFKSQFEEKRLNTGFALGASCKAVVKFYVDGKIKKNPVTQIC